MRRASLLSVVALLVAGGGASSRAQVVAPGVRAELVRLGVAVE